ncbi:hypothetical protein L596_024209 [Steinernema carpocapsae]|uniref:Uncharacterized protein n=1 Tax=Steinernema carpocapsae TaxID=34508 RepID=A0A4U5MG43_STECR|nr:hypothetical protein L596_024209 [Steinernema carpocapsae]
MHPTISFSSRNTSKWPDPPSVCPASPDLFRVPFLHLPRSSCILWRFLLSSAILTPARGRFLLLCTDYGHPPPKVARKDFCARSCATLGGRANVS